MILYHGTAESRLKRILKSGLKPRGRGRQGNWTGDTESMAGMVYVSSWLPLLYAGTAQRGGNDRMAIVEVELEPHELYPDEDFLRLASRAPRSEWSTLHPLEHQHAAQDSLRFLGTAATTGVGPKRLGRSVVVPNDIELWSRLGGDVSVSPVAFRLFGEKYARLLKVLFDRGPDAALEEARADSGPSFP